MSFLNVKDAVASGETLVFGHRGASFYAPMNTLPAFELALQQGAAGIELDVRLTQDKQMVIIHDADVNHTTNGEGQVSQLTFDQIRALDAGAWKDEKFRGVQIPTLDEVFDLVGGKFLINVEIKAEEVRSDGVEALVADSIRRHGLADSVFVSSFNPLTLRRFRPLFPEVALGFLHAEDTPFFLPPLLTGFQHEARHPHHEQIDARYMKWAKAHGYAVNTWTVNDPERAITLKNWGVNAIITDKPDVILNALQGR